MAESQFLMWMKRKEILKPHTDLLQAPLIGALNNSWEERAFAEDAARILNGFMWPPRSYSCSFCKREFRSAQALGGHMNVHRRDRARLKHCPNPQDENPYHHHHNDWKNSPDPQFSAEIFSKLDSFDLSPNNSRISAFPKQEISCGQTTIFPHSSSSSLSWGQKNGSPDTKKDNNSKGLTQNICVETNLSVGLNSLFGRKLPRSSCGDEAISCKRAKIAASAVPNFLRSYPSDRSQALKSAELVHGLKKNGMEDLDLELRLGKLPQKV